MITPALFNMDRVPTLEKLTRSAWFAFVAELEVYRARGGSRRLKELIIPSCLLLLAARLEHLQARDQRDRVPLRDMSDDDVMEGIDALFSPRSTIEAMDQFGTIAMTTRTLSVEGVLEYVQQYSVCKERCNPAVQPTDKWLRKAFVKGLRPSRLQDRVSALGPDSLQHAMMLAIDEADALVAMMREVRHMSGPSLGEAPSPARPVRPLPASGGAAARPVPPPAREPSRPESGRPIGACFGCGAMGHRQRDCPSRSPQDDRGRQVGERPRDAPRGDRPQEDRAREPMRWSREAGSLRRDPRPAHGKVAGGDGLRRVDVVLKGTDGTISARALLDSGASREFVSHDTYERLLSVGVVSKRSATAIKQLSGTCSADMELSLMLRIEGNSSRSVEVPIRPVVVAGLDEDMILSLPLLESTGLLSLLAGEQPAPASDFEDTPDTDDVGVQVDISEYDGTLPDVSGAEDEVALRALLAEYSDIFGPLPREGADVPAMRITLKQGMVPRYIPPRRMSPAMQEVVAGEVSAWSQDGIIRPSSSEVSAPVVLVAKREGGYRLCIDYRELNRCTVDLRFPIESTRAVLERLARKGVYGKLDLRTGFHQLLLDEESRPLTAFSVQGGLWEFCRVQFGLKNGPTYFQQSMVSVLGGLVGQVCEIFIDDIVVYGVDSRSFMDNLRLVFGRLRDRRLRVKGSKCTLGQKSIEYLGHVVTPVGIALSEERKQGLQGVQPPVNVSQLRSFLGMATYFRPFIRNFAQVAKPLHSMCSEKKTFMWTDAAQEAFDELKAAILSAPLLHFLDYEKEIVVRTDASQVGVGGILLQKEGGKEMVVCYVSRAFNETEARWATIEQEGYAVYFAITSFDHYIRGHRFVVETDHRNLMFLHKSVAPKIIRWRLRLQAYDFDIVHIPGHCNAIADALSRCLAGKDMPHGSDIMVVHNAVVGHRGVKRTIELLQESGVEWASMQSDVEAFIRSCPTCQKVRLGQGNVAAAVKTTMVKEPFSVVAVDTIGPITADAYGNAYVVVLIDCFSRFVELTPAKDATALEAARALLSVFGRYGIPKSVRSDNGPQFAASVVDNMLHLMGVGHDFSIPHRPESNGLVERANKEVNRHLRSLIMDQRNGETWSLYLPSFNAS